MKTLFSAMIAAALLTACASQGGYQGMSPEQLTAMAKMKDANVNCIKGSTPVTGQFFTVFVTLDKGVIPEGGITVDGDCRIAITNSRVVTTVTTTTTPIQQPAATSK